MSKVATRRSVFVVDTNKQPLNPVHPGYARWLLDNKKAAVFRQYPFTIILKKEVRHPKLNPLRIKIDPGSKATLRYVSVQMDSLIA